MSQKEPYNIKTEEDFNRVMEEIDKELRDENVPIPARQIKGSMKFAVRFGMELDSRTPLSQRIMNWFDARYGDKLARDFSPGGLATMIRGDLYRIRFPFILSIVQFICDPRPRYWMPKAGYMMKGPQGILPVINVLNCIEGLTQSYASTLTKDEQSDLTQLFNMGLAAMLAIDRVSGVSFVAEAKGNLAAAVNLLFDSPAQYGLSKWESLQATEKFFKAYLTKKGVTPPHTHDLQKLEAMTASKGLPPISATDLNKIQCPAGVRYGQPQISAQEALDAHHAAIRVCAVIANNL